MKTTPEKSEESRALVLECCREQTLEHINMVRENIDRFNVFLLQRGIEHDRSKLGSPEIEGFAFQGVELANLEYGSVEYQQNLERLREILRHHYAENRHHPEFFENGINGMNLVDIVEMFCDWLAAVQRGKDGNIYKSIDICAERFGIEPQLKQILINTADAFEQTPHSK